VDGDGTARRNSVFFEVDAQTARLHINPAYAPLALAYKERAAFTQDQLLAAMPAGPFAHQYVYLDFQAKHGRLLLARPGDEEQVAQRLWDALAQHYKGELKPAVATTPADWPRINEEWIAMSRASAIAGAANKTGSNVSGKTTTRSSAATEPQWSEDKVANGNGGG